MLYDLYQAQDDLTGPVRVLASLTAGWVSQAPRWVKESYAARSLAAGLDVFCNSGITHRRPAFGFDRVMVGNREVEVRERVVHSLPFGDLLRFEKETAIQQPRVLVVAPLSGHFATLLRGTVATLLPEHDVFITDWRNARDVPLSAGAFGLDNFIEHTMGFMEAVGQGGHVLAVCQPTVGVLAAMALLAQARSPAQPASMTLMAGPIDTRLNPTKVNELAKSKPIEWFEQQRDRHGARPLCRGRAARLSRLHAANGVHVDEHGPPRQGVQRPVRSSGGRRQQAGRDASQIL